MKIAVIGGTGLIGSQVVKILNASGHEAVPHSPSSRPGPAQRAGPARGAEGRRRRGQPDELADLRRRLARVLPDDHGQPAGRRRGRRGRPRGHPVDRRRRAGAGSGLLPREGAAGGHPQGRPGAVLDRPRHAVLRVHERGAVLDRGREDGPPAGHAGPADGRGRHRPGGGRRQRGRPAAGHPRLRRPRGLPARRTGPDHPRRPRRPAHRRHRRQRRHVRRRPATP